MSCEKASRRLRHLIGKARRLGLSTEEVASLPSTKKLVSTRVIPIAWTTIATAILIIVGAVLLLLFCAPCIARSKT